MTTTDKIKLGLAFLLLTAGVAGFYYLDNQAAVVRLLAVQAGVAAAAGVAWMSQPGKQFLAFSKESVAETRRVVWPTRKETMQTTGVVFLLVVGAYGRALRCKKGRPRQRTPLLDAQIPRICFFLAWNSSSVITP